MTDVDLDGPAMTAARRFVNEWSDHRRVRGNVSQAIRAHYAKGTPLEDVVTWSDHEGPLIGARELVAAINAEASREPTTTRSSWSPWFVNSIRSTCERPRVIPAMSFRYMLRLDDGSDAGEVELEQPATAAEEIGVTGNVRARVRAVVPVEIVEEFVDRPLYGFLEVEWLE